VVPRHRGAQALANILFGDVNPSANSQSPCPKRTPNSPPKVPGLEDATFTSAGRQNKVKPSTSNTRGSQSRLQMVRIHQPAAAFPFGFGLSYTTYAYFRLTVDDANHTVRFTVRNTAHAREPRSPRSTSPLPSAARKSLQASRAWQRVKLLPANRKQITLPALALAHRLQTPPRNGWQLLPGDSASPQAPSQTHSAQGHVARTPIAQTKPGSRLRFRFFYRPHRTRKSAPDILILFLLKNENLIS